MEQRVGRKIQKWDEVNGTVTETVDVTVEVPGDTGKANPLRSLEDQIEQNDNMLDGVINNLPEETIAIYIFKYNDKVLKIGKAGKMSGQRFQYQHYNPNSCKSNMAKSILDDREYYREKELNSIPEYNLNNKEKSKSKYEEISNWILNNTKRTNIYISNLDKSVNDYFILNLFESILHFIYQPRYEG